MKIQRINKIMRGLAISKTQYEEDQDNNIGRDKKKSKKKS